MRTKLSWLVRVECTASADVADWTEEEWRALARVMPVGQIAVLDRARPTGWSAGGPAEGKNRCTTVSEPARPSGRVRGIAITRTAASRSPGPRIVITRIAAW